MATAWFTFVTELGCDETRCFKESPLPRRCLRSGRDCFGRQSSLGVGASPAGSCRLLHFELEVDYQSLPGTSKADKARELIAHLERREGLSELLAACERHRPQVAWYTTEMAQIERVKDDKESPLNEEQARVQAKKEQLLSELLAPMVMQLERTKQAFERWRGKNLYLEAEIIRKGNLAVRDLLIEKAGLVPADLIADANRLVIHYDRWLEEYDRIRGGAEPDLNEPFVFVGPMGYPFPTESERRFKARFEEVRQEVYG